MSKTALLFPGQGSQYVGMARDLYESSEDVQALYSFASEEIGDNIAEISFDGPVEKLRRTKFTQPAILLHSLSVLICLKDRLPEFDYAAGHSLGEYGALAAAGALTHADAVRAVVRRAALMEEACQAHPSTMAAILGLDSDKVKSICDISTATDVVVPANFNSSIQVVISGDVNAAQRAVELAIEAGAKRAVMLDVGGAFHSPLMESAKTGMERYLENANIATASKPVIANVTARPASDPQQIRELLVKQITAPVRWSETMTWLKENGVTSVIEIGPGKVLSGLAKREMKPDSLASLDTLKDIRTFAEVPA